MYVNNVVERVEVEDNEEISGISTGAEMGGLTGREGMKPGDRGLRVL